MLEAQFSPLPGVQLSLILDEKIADDKFMHSPLIVGIK